MGWGEPQGPSAYLTAKAELRRRHDALTAAVAEHRTWGTTGSAERMFAALDMVYEAEREVVP